jgi:DNA invertase Pin-like site-specific DNA recombinase
MALIGYARVSTDGQTLDGQIEQLKQAGCETVFKEKESGIKTDRPQLRKMLKALDDGDNVLVTRLDRLARSTRHLLNILHDIEHAGASFKSLADAWADTTTPHGKLILTVMGGMAEFERSLILARTNEGRKRAIANGKRMGRTPILKPVQRREALKRKAAGEALSDIAAMFNVSLSTIVRLKGAEIQAA